MAWGGSTLKGPQGLDLESIFDKRTRNKSMSFSVVTNVEIIKASMISDISNLALIAIYSQVNLWQSELYKSF